MRLLRILLIALSLVAPPALVAFGIRWLYHLGIPLTALIFLVLLLLWSDTRRVLGDRD